MTQYVNVPLSNPTYERIKRWAEAHQQDVGEAIAAYLTENLPADESVSVPPAEPDPQLEQEKAAYLQLYPKLRRQYMGQFVAIHGGQLVDHDVAYGALFERIDDLYPDTFVWLTRVEDDPMGTIVYRSPRIVASGT